MPVPVHLFDYIPMAVTCPSEKSRLRIGLVWMGVKKMPMSELCPEFDP